MAEDSEQTREGDEAHAQALAKALGRDREAGLETRRARAAARAALFGKPVEGTKVDRYILLDPLGAGAMGSVYTAYDPKLDRKVALKVLNAGSFSSEATTGASEGQQILVREAQALAQVRHPNVLHVYDAGTFGEEVYLTMELVEGQTLRGWLERDPQRPWEDTLRMLMQAGRGLAAVHAAGLVHRDFKPDNVLIGKDGVAKVADFGLARADTQAAPDVEGTAPGRVGSDRTLGAGTPAYLAPERALGIPADARSDLFSFCVVVFEALSGKRPFDVVAISTGSYTADARAELPTRVPSWLAKALVRGLDPDPAARQGSLEEFLAELEAGMAGDVARVRRQASTKRMGIGLALVAAIGAGVYGAGRVDRSSRVASCEAAARQIDAVWNDEARDRIRRGLSATGHAYASEVAEKVMPWLDEYTTRWSEARRTSCEEGRVTRTWGAALLDRADWCLDETRIELAAVIDQLARADEGVVENAVMAASTLGTPSSCGNEQFLRRLPVPPAENRSTALEIREELGRTKAMLSTGRYAEGLEMIDPVIERAHAAGLASLEAALLDAKGTLLEGMVDYPGAEEASKAAYAAAVRADAWGTAADAATSLAYNVGRVQRRPDEGELWAEQAQLALERSGDNLGLRAAWLLGAQASVAVAREDWETALALGNEELTQTRRALGPEHPRVASVMSDLGISYAMARQLDRAEELARSALAIRDKTLGPDHPSVAKSLSNVAHVLHDKGDSKAAREFDLRSLETFERALGPEHPAVARSLLNLGVGHYRVGEFEEGNVSTRRALEIYEKVYGPEHLEVGTTAGNLGQGYSDLGDDAQAEPLLRRRVEIYDKHLPADDPRLADALGILGDTLLHLGRPDEALPLLERAAEIIDTAEAFPPTELSIRFGLARALVATGGDRARALALVRDGLAEHEQFAPLDPVDPQMKAEIDAFVADG